MKMSNYYDEKVIPFIDIQKQNYNIKAEINNKKYNSKEPPDFSAGYIIYNSCEFSHLTFTGVNFKKVFFVQCTFIFCNFNNCSCESIENDLYFACCFINLTKFTNSKLMKTFVVDSILKSVSFENVRLNDSLFAYNCFYSTSFLKKSDLRYAIILGTSGWFDLYFDNEDGLVKVNENTMISDFNYKDLHHLKEHKIFSMDVICAEESAKNTFGRLAIQFKINGVSKISSQQKYYAKVANMNFYKKYKFSSTSYFKKWIEESFYYKLSSFGERPLKSFVICLLIIFFFALIYMNTGISINNIEYSMVKLSRVNYSSVENLFFSCLHFSVMTFTTVGYGDIVPSAISRIFSDFEAIIGVLFIAVFTTSFVRKMLNED